MDRTITIRIPDDLKNDLESLSKTENKPVSDIVRDSLRKYVLLARFRKLREKTLPFAEAQGILTDDDVFKIMS